MNATETYERRQQIIREHTGRQTAAAKTVGLTAQHLAARSAGLRMRAMAAEKLRKNAEDVEASSGAVVKVKRLSAVDALAEVASEKPQLAAVASGRMVLEENESVDSLDGQGRRPAPVSELSTSRLRESVERAIARRNAPPAPKTTTAARPKVSTLQRPRVTNLSEQGERIVKGLVDAICRTSNEDRAEVESTIRRDYKHLR